MVVSPSGDEFVKQLKLSMANRFIGIRCLAVVVVSMQMTESIRQGSQAFMPVARLVALVEGSHRSLR
jgi:hypothetical protein